MGLLSVAALLPVAAGCAGKYICQTGPGCITGNITAPAAPNEVNVLTELPGGFVQNTVTVQNCSTCPNGVFNEVEHCTPTAHADGKTQYKCVTVHRNDGKLNSVFEEVSMVDDCSAFNKTVIGFDDAGNFICNIGCVLDQ